MTVLIVLTTAGANTGPFNLFSNVDGFITAFESGVAKSALVAGYTSALVPNGTTTIRVQSVGACTNYIDIVIGATTTTTSTTSSGPTTTTTTTISPTLCGEYSLEGGIEGRTFNFTDCDGVPQTVIVNPGDVSSACITLPYSATGATYISPCGTSTLSMSYLGGDGGSSLGAFTFNLSSALPSNITISGGSIEGYTDTGGGCDVLAFTANQSSTVTITSGSTLGGSPSSTAQCADRLIRVNSLTVNGNPVVDGDTLIIGGVTLTISLPNTCQIMGCIF